jgi:NAD(P)-dependent dehydrogenase (short-subunit alcohol dehydrogenase family)
VAGYRRGLRLPGGVVVVAGAAGPVGAAVAAALADAGARPVLLDRPGAALDRTAARCADRARPAPVIPVDLADGDAVRDAARRVVETCGRLDGWVQCAMGDAPGDRVGDAPGLGTASGALADLPLREVRRVLDADLLGAVHGARAAVPAMAAHGGGVLVVVVSVHGQIARPHDAPRSMAHAAVRAMAGALRQELRLDGVRGVAVAAVLAPAVDPPGGPFPAGRPSRVAATVLGQLRRPRLEVVAGGPLTKAVVHGHALAPAATEWLVAQRARGVRRAADRAGNNPDRGVENGR